MFGSLAYAVSETFFLVIDPLLPYKLANDFHFNEAQIGVFFFRFTASAVIFTFVFLLIPDSKVNKVLLGGGFLASVGAFMTGPSRLFGFPNKLDLIKAGLIVSGLGKALLTSYSFAYCVKSGQEGFPESRKEEVERKVPLVAGFSYGLAGFVVPLGMSLLNVEFGLRASLDLLGGVFTVYAIGFTIHAAKHNWGRSQEARRGPLNEEEAALIRGAT